MYVDDTTIYAMASNPDLVVTALNKVLSKLHVLSGVVIEFMLLSRGNFVGPLQGIKLGESYIKLYMKVIYPPNRLSVKVGGSCTVIGLIRSLNLLKSLYFLPTKAKVDFHFKVIIITFNYIWNNHMGFMWNNLIQQIREHSCKSCQIYIYIIILDWLMPTNKILAYAKWKTLNDLYRQRLLYLVFNCYHGHSPIVLQKLFIKYTVIVPVHVYTI